MKRLGAVKALYRHPVKSMGGESLERTVIGPNGLPGDRGWAVRDEGAGEIRGAKKLPKLLQCTARYLTEPGQDQVPEVEIGLPDGQVLRSDDPVAAAGLSVFLGRAVTLWPLQPASKLDHYRRGRLDHQDRERSLRETFALLEDEPLPDLTGLPEEIGRYVSPLGTYFDAYPLHLLATASLDRAAALGPASAWDVRRFRPNMLIEAEGGASGFVEEAWCGQEVMVGRATLRIEMPTPRCSMAIAGQASLPRDPLIMRTLVRHMAHNLGVYATVTAPGNVAVGDEVMLFD